MKIPKGQIELACMKEEMPSKYRLDCVFFDAENKRVIASDGHCLVRVSVECAPDEKGGLIPWHVMQWAWHVMQWARRNGGESIVFGDKGMTVKGAEAKAIAIFPKEEGQFPNTDAVFPEFEGDAAFTFNIGVLVALARSMKAIEYGEDEEEVTSDANCHVAVYMPKGGDVMKPSLIAPVGSWYASDAACCGLVMPIKREGFDYKTEGADTVLKRGGKQ